MDPIKLTDELRVFGVPVEILFRPLESVDPKRLEAIGMVLKRELLRMAPPLPSFKDFSKRGG